MSCMHIKFGLLFFCTLLTAGATNADPPQHAPKNAALSYWQAFALMPEANEEHDKILKGWDSADLGEAAEQLIRRGANSLALWRRGASIDRCDWGSALEEGPAALLPHLGKARQMARLACLRARQRFESGQHREAWQDVRTTLVAARHVGSEQLLISVLVQFAMERMAIEAVAPHLLAIPKDQLPKMLSDLQSLPPRGTILQGIEGEEKWMLGWLRREFVEAGCRDDAERTKFMETLVGDDPKAKQAAEALLKQPEDLKRLLDEVDAYYDEMVLLLDLPMAEQEVAWSELEDRIQGDSNALAQLLLPAIGKAAQAEHVAVARAAMLRAAIDMVHGGPARLRNYPDPFGDKPLQRKDLADGFELRSAALHRDEPATLLIGGAGQ